MQVYLYLPQNNFLKISIESSKNFLLLESNSSPQKGEEYGLNGSRIFRENSSGSSLQIALQLYSPPCCNMSSVSHLTTFMAVNFFFSSIGLMKIPSIVEVHCLDSSNEGNFETGPKGL